MSHDLQRFLDAQASSYPTIKSELSKGRKESHWIWFAFPQAAGLGTSSMSERYAIRSPEEAKAYADHPILGARLRECTRMVLAAGRPAEQVMGSSLDAMKLRSSLTLFRRATSDPLFDEALERLFGGVECPHTVRFCGDRD
jgi:uncharacterized protein (DUF1810 family)